MIKLRDIIKENEDGIDKDRLFYNDQYLDQVADQLGYPKNFTNVFWLQKYLPKLYHCTTIERYEQIRVEGLKKRKERRGATSGNRHVGPAVFTTSEPEEVSFFQRYYGPIVISIDTKQMKSDGFMPEVEKEPDWSRAEKLEFVLHKLGDHVSASEYVDSSDQNSQGTVIIYSDIPIKYLSLVKSS